MNDYILRLYSTSDLLSVPNRLLDFFGALSKVSSKGVIRGELAFSGSEKTHLFSSMDELQEVLENIVWEGRLVIAFGVEGMFTGGFELFCFDIDATTIDVSKEEREFSQNEVRLKLSPSFVSELNVGTYWAEIVSNLAVIINANYGFFHPAGGQQTHTFISRELGDGIADIFSVNYFGMPYIDMFTKEKSKSFPGFFVNFEEGSGLTLQVTDDACVANKEKFLLAAFELRNIIGEDYFVSKDKKKNSLKSGEVGLFYFIWNMWKSYRKDKSMKYVARVKPQFDRSGMFK